MGKRKAWTEGSEEEAMSFDHCVTKEYIVDNEMISVFDRQPNTVIQFEVA